MLDDSSFALLAPCVFGDRPMLHLLATPGLAQFVSAFSRFVATSLSRSVASRSMPPRPSCLRAYVPRCLPDQRPINTLNNGACNGAATTNNGVTQRPDKPVSPELDRRVVSGYSCVP